jgi:hypothetical protein
MAPGVNRDTLGGCSCALPGRSIWVVPSTRLCKEKAMDTMHNVIAMQYAQERIARAQAERLAKEARQVKSRTRSRRAFRRFRRPVVANAVASRR